MWDGIAAHPFSGFCQIHLLEYPLAPHIEFQKLPVSSVGENNILILFKTETGSFQNVFCVVIIGNFFI